MSPSRPYRWPFVAALGAAAVLLAGCGSSSHRAATTPSRAVSPSRCAANRAAGPVTYLTGFGFQASTGILDAVGAQASGLYTAECLDVTLRPGNGDPGTAAQLTASGKTTFAELGSPSDAITNVAHGIDVDAVATYGNVPAVTLLTSPAITNLRQLEGRTLGYKGAMPPQITAMLIAAGVDVTKVREVGVGFDPTVLSRGQVDALTAYKSNEPVQLRDAGDPFRQWDPDRFGVGGSFNVIDVNRAFAAAHPTAVEDFLRATLRAFGACVANPTPCIAAASHLQPGYNARQNTEEWKIQSSEASDSRLPGQGVGAETLAQWQPEADLLVRFHLVDHPPALGPIVDPHFVAAIYRGPDLVWPGP
ncbi:MAG: ABC transporter substrate-binding protein [Actinomycetota bacterium]|nr:ABC transporter substrate-binding protein [Actinomycetota bacterium]